MRLIRTSVIKGIIEYMTHTGSWQEIFLVRICCEGHSLSTTVIAALATITISTCHHDSRTSLVTGSPWLMINVRKWRSVSRTHFFTQWEKILTILKTILKLFLNSSNYNNFTCRTFNGSIICVIKSDVCGVVFSDLIVVIVFFPVFSHGIINMSALFSAKHSIKWLNSIQSLRSVPNKRKHCGLWRLSISYVNIEEIIRK